MEEPTAVPTRSQDIFNANTGLQCFLYCSANKLGTRPFDSRSLKIDKKYWGHYCYKGGPSTGLLPFNKTRRAPNWNDLNKQFWMTEQIFNQMND